MSLERIFFTNTLKTYIVLALYIGIFIVIGLLVDIVRIDALSLSSGFAALLSFQEFPLVTCIMACVGGLIVLWTLNRFDVVMLKGEEYELLQSLSNPNVTQRRILSAFDEVLRLANFKAKPKLYLIYADYMNAFASGWKEENSLVAITLPLAQNLDDDELKAVLAHEISHIRHGDIRLTMCVGILSNILLLVCNSATYLFMGGNRNSGAQSAKMILLVLQFVLPLLTMWLQMFLSRSREYMADGGSAYIMGDPHPLISALQKISNHYATHHTSALDSNPTRRAAYIFDFSDAFSTHPSLKNRIKSLLHRSNTI